MTGYTVIMMRGVSTWGEGKGGTFIHLYENFALNVEFIEARRKPLLVITYQTNVPTFSTRLDRKA